MPHTHTTPYTHNATQASVSGHFIAVYRRSLDFRALALKHHFQTTSAQIPVPRPLHLSFYIVNFRGGAPEIPLLKKLISRPRSQTTSSKLLHSEFQVRST